MTILVVQAAVENYGSTYDQVIVVPLTMVTENHATTSPSKKKTTTTMKGRMACLLGLTTAAVVSSAMFFVSRRESSAVVLRAATRTDAEASLLHRTDGTCVVQSGAWPAHTESVDDDAALFGLHSAYATCFVFQVDNGVDKPGAFCWSRSYQNKDGDWKPCKPKGYGSDGWTKWVGADDDAFEFQHTVSVCGQACTEFE